MSDQGGASTQTAASAVSVLRVLAARLPASATEEATALLTLASQLEADASGEVRSARLEKYRAELANWQAEVQHSLDWDLENFRSIIQFGRTAIHSALLINGGAAIALLAYLGNARAVGMDTGTLVAALACFGIGVLAAACAGACSYLAQYFYRLRTKEGDRGGGRWHWAAALVGLLALLAFGGGLWGAYQSFSTSNEIKTEVTAMPTQNVQSPSTVTRNAPGPVKPSSTAPNYSIPAQAPAQPATTQQPASEQKK